MQLGLFDSNKADQPYFNLGIDDIDTPSHQALALEAAQQAVVLLKNEKNVLPLQPGLKIAIVGPHFNATDLLISNYHGSRCLDPSPKPGLPSPLSFFFRSSCQNMGTYPARTESSGLPLPSPPPLATNPNLHAPDQGPTPNLAAQFVFPATLSTLPAHGWDSGMRVPQEPRL